jgi:hypothetical protein
MAGKISRGNAFNLADSLKGQKFEKAYKYLQEYKEAATKNKCTSVLLSCEDLVHYLADSKTISLFIDTAFKAGFTTIKAMGFFRDIVDHAISTYKHRAKTGKHPDYNYWIENNYETPNLLVKLFKNVEQYKESIDWNIRKFKKDSEYLQHCFFNEWLDVRIPKFETLPNVNESVTLSEVKVLNHLKTAYPLVVDYFMEDLKALPKGDKAKDKHFDNYLAIVFSAQLRTFNAQLSKINVHFREDEKLILNTESSTSESLKEPEINLNDKQLSLVIKNIKFFNTTHGKLILLRRKAVFLLRKISKPFKT